MTPETTSRHLDDIDIVLAKYRVLPQNSYLQGAFTHLLEGAQILTAMYGEKRDKDNPVIQPPQPNEHVEFVENLLKDIDNLSANIRKDAEIIDPASYDKVPNSVIYLMAWTKIEQSKLYVKVFYEEAKAEKKEFDEYETRLKAAKNVVILISEDVKLKSYVEPAVKSIWPSIYEKEGVYFHNEIEEYISKFMKAPNVRYDSLHCDECLKKFDLQTTIFYLIGFKQGEKLPVDLPEEAYYVGV